MIQNKRQQHPAFVDLPLNGFAVDLACSLLHNVDVLFFSIGRTGSATFLPSPTISDALFSSLAGSAASFFSLTGSAGRRLA
jgi:hypothetical protein